MPPPLRIVLALIALVAASCASTDKQPAARLVGRWRATTQSQTAEYSFASDGTFAGSVKSSTATISKFTGTWALVDGAIAYTYTSDSLGRIPPGTKDRDRLLEVGDSFYVIEAADGSRRRYERAPGSRFAGLPL